MKYPETPDSIAEAMDQKISSEEAKKLGNEIGVDWDKIDLEELRMGIEVEFEHADVTDGNQVMTTKIALAHLKELPDYYTRLKKMEA